MSIVRNICNTHMYLYIYICILYVYEMYMYMYIYILNHTHMQLSYPHPLAQHSMFACGGWYVLEVISTAIFTIE